MAGAGLKMGRSPEGALMHRLSMLVLSALVALSLAAQRVPHPDHHEFEAALTAPFLGEQGEARTFRLLFQFPDAEGMVIAGWRLELRDPKGRLVRMWRGEMPVGDRGAIQKVFWDGRDAQGNKLASGHYSVKLLAQPVTDSEFRQSTMPDQASRVEQLLFRSNAEAEAQTFEIQVGTPARPAMRNFQALPSSSRGSGVRSAVKAAQYLSAPATGSLPYTVYYGNLHSQTNHSDGGGDISSCTSAQNPQTGAFGPTDAFAYARNAGLDLLMASEHNHMFDGSASTNTAADPAAAKALFASGLSAASTFSATNPGFLAIYGMEWGVISNGGHLNILNPDGLANWELNASGQIIGDYNTPKGDYAGLYTFMRSKGWVGQFNHPSTSGQFQVGSTPLEYTADGDEVMALCEVLNTSAFSVNTTETEASRSSYEAAWKILLERGYHVAPSTDQDNHCANWGRSYTNRTSVLIPTGTPLTLVSFLEAVRARRVFATMDKTSQIILQANGHLMGERFSNTGPLTLTVDFASSTGQTVSKVEVYEGVPGRNGTVTLLSSAASTTLTPTDGPHYYYAKITQGNGDLLWSAPVWVTQGGSGSSSVTATISEPAADLTVDSGTAVSFAGSGTSSAGNLLTYAWSFGDGASASAVTATHAYTVSSATTFTATFTATDGLGTGIATRRVTVNPVAGANTAPTLTVPADQTTPQDTPLSGLAFTVGDAETAASALTVSARSSNQILIPDANLSLGGTAGSRTLGLTPMAGQTGTATITLTVTDGGGLATSNTFAVTVLPLSTGSGALIISQYYEGASNDKWIELTNLGGSSLNLASPQIYLSLYANTAADAPSGLAPSSSLALSGTLAPGQSLLFKNSSAVLPSYAIGTASAVVNFNGDDLVILSTANDATAWANRLDVVGNGTTWGADTSLVRAPGVITPNPTFTLAEWVPYTVAAVNAATTGATERLGLHVFNQAARIVSAAITTPATDVTIASGASVALVGTGTDSASGATLTYGWTFGDGAVATGPTAAHAFQNAGAANQTYTVTLTVTDETGASASATRLVTVTPAPDTTAPAATAAETGTQGLVTLSATATDDRAVTSVSFFVDGVLAGTDAVAPYSLSFDSTTLANGSHTLVAKAGDAAGNIGTSAPVTFSIANPDLTAPSVQAAESGTQGLISLSATASDNVGVTKVEFLLDNVLVGTDALAPFNLSQDSTTLANGTHTLVAKAYDVAGNIGTSLPVSFTISNPVKTVFSEVETNNTKSAANLVPDTATSIVGYFPSTSDGEDWFKLTLGAGRTLVVDMTGPTASGQDYDLYLYGSTTTKLASSTATSTTERITYKNPSSTSALTLYIRVLRYRSYSSVTPYTLTLSR